MPAIQEHSGGYCPNCRQQRMFVSTRHTANHLVHALVTLFLCGLWIPVWVICAVAESTEPWTCTQCGYAAPGQAQGKGLAVWLAVSLVVVILGVLLVVLSPILIGLW